ncbi:MAG: integrase family protein [Ottowia sp.]|uniref:tyrosine-type recombinase/integrase n=1 Tax=Ottowia sp. TaxID=1898956 RepID=UPI003C723CF6
MTKQANRVRLTAGRVAAFSCPADKSQAFLWDTEAPALLVRVTPSGRKTYAFESRVRGATVRITVGDVAAWTLDKARERANELCRLTDKGIDPRDVARQEEAARQAARAQVEAEALKQAEVQRAAALTTGEAWVAYVAERRPHWSERHYQSHLEKASPGGMPSKARGRGDTLTKPGPLAPLMLVPLKDLDAPTIEAWAAREGKVRPSSARLAWRQLSVFLNWCAEQPRYAELLPARNPAKTKKTREALGKDTAKQDALQREQLSGWFHAVRQIENSAIAAALQFLLLTGCRMNEALSLRWSDVNFKWKGITMHDKVEGERTIPLTPYVAHLLTGLPHRNEWVFASARALQMDAHNIRRRAMKAEKRGIVATDGDMQETSGSGHISPPNAPHDHACAVAGIEGLTLHGLRRSFGTLTEWLEIPAGVVAQIQGHKPSATAEKHYRVRPLDLLRVHHERIEAWILEQAEVRFTSQAEPGKLRTSAGAIQLHRVA